MLEIKDLTVSYQNIPTVQNFSLHMKPGQIIGLVGESGSGKTTVIRAVMGFLPGGGRVTAGDTRFEGSSLLSYSPEQWRKIRGADISMIFQDSGAMMNPTRKIGDVFALVQSVSHQVAVMYLGNLVEVLPGEDIAVKSVHPYTRARIGSIFDLHMDFSNPIERIESEIPSPLDVPPGCPFQNRCEHCTEICRRERPRLTELTPGHNVACHLFVPSGTENHEAHSPTGL